MKNILILLVLVILVLGVSGCAQTSPGTAAPPATAAITKSPVTPQKTLATTRPTPIPLPTAEQSSTVSDNTVLIQNFEFVPQVITVKAGDIVRWQNTDDVTHRIQFVDKSFSAFLLSGGQSFSQRFSRPGIYDYTCLIHPNMHGTVKVE